MISWDFAWRRCPPYCFRSRKKRTGMRQVTDNMYIDRSIDRWECCIYLQRLAVF